MKLHKGFKYARKSFLSQIKKLKFFFKIFKQSHLDTLISESKAQENSALEKEKKYYLAVSN
jgi:hypothetical protein